jgi:hypothetical protein
MTATFLPSLDRARSASQQAARPAWFNYSIYMGCKKLVSYAIMLEA